MSSKPNPVARTAALLSARLLHELGDWDNDDGESETHFTVTAVTTEQVADVASKLHRLAPAFTRQAVAECNGEQRDGQRDAIYKLYRNQPELERSALAAIEPAIEKEAERLERKLEKLNALLLPFQVVARTGGDPRGCVFWLEALPDTPPLPTNGWNDGCWNIE